MIHPIEYSYDGAVVNHPGSTILFEIKGKLLNTIMPVKSKIIYEDVIEDIADNIKDLIESEIIKFVLEVRG